MPRLRSLAAPALATAVALAILVSLGFWQLERKSWKEDLLRQIETRAYSAPGRILPEGAWPDWRAESDEFRHVELAGTFLPDLTVPIHGLAEVRRGQALQGFYLFTPLRRQDGSVVVVNRGFVPTELKDKAAPPPAGETTVVGLVRAPQTRAPFVPENDPARGSWYVRSLADIVRATGLERTAPFYVDADASPNPGGWPRGGQTELTLRNNHLQYALTWFALAAALLAVFGVFVRRRVAGRSGGELQAEQADEDQRDAAEPYRARRVAE